MNVFLLGVIFYLGVFAGIGIVSYEVARDEDTNFLWTMFVILTKILTGYEI